MSATAPRAVIRAGKWRGIRNIRNLFIFGDSYSSVNDEDSYMPSPTDKQPLGTDFPGDPWTDAGPNWVGHLLASHLPHLRIYDYAQGGATVSNNLRTQIQSKFLARHAKTVRWTAEDALFVLWIGINDLAETANPVQPIKLLFQLMNELHAAGARNFLLLDCPPIHRTPGADPEQGPNSDRFEDWNRLLFMQARFFVAKHQDYTSAKSEHAQQHHHPPTSPNAGPSPASTPSGVGVQGDTSMFVFSSWSTFSSILDYPDAYGFEEDDTDEEQGAIWMDNLHPTSKVHAILAKHIYKFLSDIE